MVEGQDTGSGVSEVETTADVWIEGQPLVSWSAASHLHRTGWQLGRSGCMGRCWWGLAPSAAHWAEVEPGVKPESDKQVSVCLSLMVVMELGGMWQRDVVRATPLVVVRCCNRTSRTTAWRHEGTLLAEAGSGGKHERRTFIPTKTGSRLLRCCMLSSVGSLTTRTGTSGHLFPKMSMSTSRMPEYGTSAPLTDCSVRKACCSERSCRWSAAHVSVTVVTSLPALQPHVHSRGSWSLDTCRSFPSYSYPPLPAWWKQRGLEVSL